MRRYNKKYLMLGFLFTLLQGCSSGPRFSSIWEHSSYNTDQRSLAVDICRLRGEQAESEFLSARPLQNQNTTNGALANLSRQLGGYKAEERAFNVCMRSDGFQLVRRCVANCEAQ